MYTGNAIILWKSKKRWSLFSTKKEHFWSKVLTWIFVIVKIHFIRLPEGSNSWKISGKMFTFANIQAFIPSQVFKNSERYCIRTQQIAYATYRLHVIFFVNAENFFTTSICVRLSHIVCWSWFNINIKSNTNICLCFFFSQ